MIIPDGDDVCGVSLHEQVAGETTMLTPNEPPAAGTPVCELAPVDVLFNVKVHCVIWTGLICRFAVRVTPPNEAENDRE